MIQLDKCLENLLDRYVREQCEKQKKYGIIGSAGFLIGSKSNEDIHVAHIAMCAHPETAQDEKGDAHSKLIDAEWISDTGSRVLRLLPGGVTIVGLLWLADSKAALQLAEIRDMLIRALLQISVHHNALSSMNIKNADSKLALIEIETPLGKPQGYIFDCSRKGAAGSKTRVSFNQLEWVRLESAVTLRLSKPLTNRVWDFHKQFTGAIHEWAECLMMTKLALVNGVVRSRDELLKPRDKRNRGASTLTTFNIETFLDAGKKQNLENEVLSSFCIIDVVIDGVAKAAVPSKSTVGQAIDAVKEHIVRSLCSRAELHYESTDVVEDEPKDRISVHQLPRAAFASLPNQPAIVFTDYLFESDTAGDAQQSFSELLNLTISEDEIDIDSERHLNEEDLLSTLCDDDKPGRVGRSSSSTSSLSSVMPSSALQGVKAATTNYNSALLGQSKAMALANRSQAFGALLRYFKELAISQSRGKSSYALKQIPIFKEEQQSEQEEEIRAKYIFRPRPAVLIENDHFDVPFQNEYDKICRENYAWDLEFSTVKTVWERLKPPPLDSVEENVIAIGNLRSFPWASNEWCIERAFDCHRRRRDIVRIHVTMNYLGLLKKLSSLRIGISDMAHQLEQKVLMERTRQLIELVCQAYYTGDMRKLIESDENVEPIVEHMYEVEKLGVAERQMLNITKEDIITVVPGVYGAIQDFFRVYLASTYSLSITCCALYQKNVLYRVAGEKYKSTKRQIAMPYEYTYRVPHLIFGNFGYWYSRKSKRFELHDLHILGFSVLPWYKDVPGTDGKFFSPMYERIPLSSSSLFS